MTTLSALAFQNEYAAEPVLYVLKKLEEQKLIHIEDAAILTRSESGKPKIKQARHIVGPGVMGGALWGMLVGIFFFAPFFGAAFGAGVGLLTMHMAFLGIDDEFIKQVGEKVRPGQAVLFVLAHDAEVQAVMDGLRPYREQFEVIATSISKENMAHLREMLGA